MRVLSRDIRDPDGKPYKVRYLFNPNTDEFVSLSDLSDDEFVTGATVANWERRLGVKLLPRGTGKLDS